jgi:hypothetical protein
VIRIERPAEPAELVSDINNLHRHRVGTAILAMLGPSGGILSTRRSFRSDSSLRQDGGIREVADTD